MCFAVSRDSDRGFGLACRCNRGFARTRAINIVLANALVAVQTPVLESS